MKNTWKSYTMVFLGLMVLAGGALKASETVTDGLAGWWNFAEGFGVTATDSSGNHNHGYLVGSAAVVSDSQMGGAVEFFGASGGVVVPYSPALAPATGTVSAWVKGSKIQAADLVLMRTKRNVRRGTNGTNYAYSLRIEKHGALTGIIGNDDPDSEYPITVLHGPGGQIKQNTWHHVAMRWDGSTLALFFEGKMVAAKAYNPVPETGLSYFGETDLSFGEPIWPNGETLEFFGRLSDVRIYTRPLSESEVGQLFAEKNIVSVNGSKKK